MGYLYQKSPNLRHRQARSQNKGLSRASWLQTGPSPTGDRQARAARAKGGNCGPREASYTKLQADFIANQDFLGFWMVDIHWEGHSQRTAPQKRHRTHLRRCARCTPKKLSGCDGGDDKTQPSTGGDCDHQAPGHLRCSDLRQAQNAGPTKSALLWSTREPETKKQRGLDLGNAGNPGPASDSSRQSNLEPEQCRLGKHTRREWGQT